MYSISSLLLLLFSLFSHVLVRFHGREQEHFLDVVAVSQQHG
jgi:hypothetical protein